MSLIKILFFTSLLYVSSVAACPTIDLKNLQCETSEGFSYVIDYVKVEGSLFSFQVFGIPVEMQLPSEEESIVNTMTYCDGDQIVTRETFDNMSAISVTNFDNDTMNIKGQSISTKCDEADGCRVGGHVFDKFIDQDITCQL